jgi:hypothetical protein
MSMLAVLLAGVLLLSNLPFFPGLPLQPEKLHGFLSAAPLALAGVGYAALQIRKRPARGTLLKRLLLAATFVAWAVDQLLPPGRMATAIGDVVIAAYVLDLYWLFHRIGDDDLERGRVPFRLGSDHPGDVQRAWRADPSC